MALTTPRLHTERLLLRPFTEADTDAIFAVFSNPRVMRYWDSPAWKERANPQMGAAKRRQLAFAGTASLACWVVVISAARLIAYY